MNQESALTELKGSKSDLLGAKCQDSLHKSRKLAVASWSLFCFSKEGGSRGPECRYLIYQALTPPPQLHPSPQYLLLLGLLLLACLVLLIAFGCLLVAADVLGHERRVQWGKRVMKSLVMFGGSMAVVEFPLCASYINYIIVTLPQLVSWYG